MQGIIAPMPAKNTTRPAFCVQIVCVDVCVCMCVRLKCIRDDRGRKSCEYKRLMNIVRTCYMNAKAHAYTHLDVTRSLYVFADN